MVGCVPRNTKRQVHWGGRDTLATQHKARKHTLQAALSSRCRLHVPPHHPPRPAQRLRRQPQLSAGRTDCRPAAAASRHPPSHGTPHCGPPALRPAEHTQPVAARRRHNAPRLAQGHWHCGQASRRAAAAPWLWPSPDPVASACSEHTGSQTQSRGNKTESLELEAEACRMQARKLTWVGHRHPGTAAVVKTIVLHL